MSKRIGFKVKNTLIIPGFLSETDLNLLETVFTAFLLAHHEKEVVSLSYTKFNALEGLKISYYTFYRMRNQLIKKRVIIRGERKYDLRLNEYFVERYNKDSTVMGRMVLE